MGEKGGVFHREGVVGSGHDRQLCVGDRALGGGELFDCDHVVVSRDQLLGLVAVGYGVQRRLSFDLWTLTRLQVYVLLPGALI
jgi:hypothetical protein